MVEILGFAALLGYLQASITKIQDPRKNSPNKHYSVFDAVMGAFGAFFYSVNRFWSIKDN